MDAIQGSSLNALQSSLDVLEQLIRFNSVSSETNAPIASWLRDSLSRLGFAVEWTEYRDKSQVRKVNLVARRGPSGGGGLAYFCHSDVVPAADWSGPGGNAYEPVRTEERLYGRGACDMKGSLAAMLAAVALQPHGSQSAPLWIVCTADEEVGFAGAKHVVAESSAYRELVAAQPVGIVGEPTMLRVVHAHKGITGFHVASRGRAAHSSTASGINANVAMVPMLNTILELEQRTRDDRRYHDARFDPPTLSWNFGVSDRATAINITPSRSDAWVSLRTMPDIDGEDLIEIARRRAEELGLEFSRFDGGGFLWVDPHAPCVESMCELAGGSAETVCYSTDGGQFTELRQLLVCGPGDITQAHTTDEWISFDQLTRGIDLYARAIRRWCY